MAVTTTYRTTISPDLMQTVATEKEGEFTTDVVLSPTNFDALVLFIQEIKAGTDVSSVVTAINAL